MNEQSVVKMLQEAYAGFQSLDIELYADRLETSKEWIDANDPNGAIYGEWMLVSSLADITDIALQCEKYREALRCIGGRSRVFPARAHMFGSYYNPLAIINSTAGHADEKADKLGEAVALFHKLTGGGKGTDTCYRAQLAFYRGDLPTAQVLAMEAFEAARENEQELIVLCAIQLLAEIAKHKEDNSLWRFAYMYIEAMAYGTRATSRACREQAQVVFAILSLSVGILKKLPAWIEKNEFGAISTDWGYRISADKISAGTLTNALLTQVSHYSYKGEPIKALNSADMLQKVYRVDNVITNAYLDFFRAGCYIQLNNVKQACAAVSRAVKQIAPDGLWLIAAEFEPPFGDMLYFEAQKVCNDAPEIIRSIGQEYWKKLEAFRKTIMQETQVILTKREREIVPLLCEGKNNTEIADTLFISKKTVKRHVGNIYSKLNINRRAQVSKAVKIDEFAEAAFWTRQKN